jgi:hypothetical protein
MTTDRCIHRIAHNTARARVAYGVFSRAAVRTRLLSSLYRPLSDTFHMPLSASLPTHPPSSSERKRKREREREGERERENERASERAYARPHYPRSRRAPRSLIVHRNRNCVPASHARGLPRSRNVRPSVRLCSASGLNPSVLRRARVTGNRRLRSSVDARSTNRTSVSRASVALVIDLSAVAAHRAEASRFYISAVKGANERLTSSRPRLANPSNVRTRALLKLKWYKAGRD